MGQVVVKRPPRVLPPVSPAEQVRVQPPPELPRGQQEGVLMQLLPLLGMGGSVVFLFLGKQTIMMVMGGLMIASTVTMAIAMMVRHRRGNQGQLADLRRDYLRHLAQARRAVRKIARTQRDVQLFVHPAPEQLWALVAEGSRVWERRVGDPDFVQVRVGLGSQALAAPLEAPETAPVDELEPLTAGALKRFLAVHSTVDDLPMAVSLRAFYHVTVSGDEERARDEVRAVVGQLGALHSPADLVVAVAAGERAAAEWEWVKWLPHAQARDVSVAEDGAGCRRLVAGGVRELEELLGGVLEGRPRFRADGEPLVERPHVVVVLDGVTVVPGCALASADGLQGVTVVEVVPGELGDEDARGALSVVVREGALRLESGRAEGAVVYEGVPDALEVAAAEALARQLAPLRAPVGVDEGEPLLAELEFTDLLELGDAGEVEVARTWRARPRADRLRVPIGVGEDGAPVLLDLKEAAQEGMGPHGLCVGATGSGKSELLRTLVLGLAVTHSSETLNFVLADFKGGATFAGMARLPHVAAVITNLADDLSLVDRMGDSIRGELNRRQELLRDAGNYANVHDYERARAAGVRAGRAPLAPIPSLVLVIDEFSELLTAMPDFIEMFVQIGRIGRSLGVHLLLASQRLEEGRLRGLETYLSYRVGLRTFSAAESRAALGVPDAYRLPNVPGSGYLKHGTDELVRFKAAYVSGPYRSGADAGDAGTGPGAGARQWRGPVRFTAGWVDPGAGDVRDGDAAPEARSARGGSGAPEAHGTRGDTPDGADGCVGTVPPPARSPGGGTEEALGESVLDVVVRRLEGRGPGAHQVWLPPLDSPPALDAFGAAGALTVPLGYVDKPYEQRRDVLVRDFSGAGGHMQIVGGPRSGKSTLLRTLVAAFAWTHSPRDVQFYGLDFGGGGLSAVAGLPHVGGVASRLDPERVRRTVAEVHGVLADREELFRAAGIDSVATCRTMRARGEGAAAAQPWGDVFLVVDGWGNFRTEYEALEPVVVDIAARGLGYGVHVVLTASRSMEVRGQLKDLLMNRLELRLGDVMDSELDRKAAAQVPAGVPGRGLTPEKLHFMGAVPRCDGVESAEGLAAATAALVREVRERWADVPRAPRVRLLPRELPARELPGGGERPGDGVAFGVDEDRLEPVFADFERDPFFLVFGEGESGRTNLLRLLIGQLSERYAGEDCKFFVIDDRRGLLGAAPPSHLAEYVPMSHSMDHHVEALAELMRRRAPSADVTARELKERSWWEGPTVFVVVDDYDLVATSSGNPLAPLVELLPFARDVGVRFVLARNTAGASRAAYEPFVQRMVELGAQGVVLSGDPNEGEVFAGVRPRPLPVGRGVAVSRRRGAALVQTGWVEQGGRVGAGG
ncbi:type VII secretion protein EccCa [Streptomyces sp. NPDC088745]|uniref:type VII secretion protein EccCa n=1 Tax=Streptomyces sp. NPDC088745 TaxID=3365884 RepID=UPI00382846D1